MENFKTVIKFIETKGFKEYKPSSSVEDYDRAWQRIFNKDEDNQIMVNLNFWQHSKHNVLAEDTFEFVIYTDSDSRAIQVHLYAWKDLDKNIAQAYQEVEKFIKFLDKAG